MGLAMKKIAHFAVMAAGFAAVSAVATSAHADFAPSLQSFGTSKAISAYELSATGVTGYELQPTLNVTGANDAVYDTWDLTPRANPSVTSSACRR